ncbi:MAG: proton-conducting transporter membrane subunit, partial [Chlamydiota bacterium]
MYFYIAAFFFLIIGSLSALLTYKEPKLCSKLSAIFISAASVITIVPSLQVLFYGAPLVFSLPWHVPFGEFSLQLDPLSAVFSLIISIISITVTWYGKEYLKPWFGKKNIGIVWFFLQILIMSLFLIILAKNSLLFFVAWEIMSVTSFFLITFEDEKPEVQKGGLNYLIATQLSSLFLLPLFLLSDASSFFLIPGALSILFLLSFVGFGTKAGFVPFHIWLPDAYASAPSYISALLSS